MINTNEVTAPPTQVSGKVMNADRKRPPCNGSLRAFADGFRAVAGREPEEFVDYNSCCFSLWKFNEKTLTEEQLEECRARGEKCGRSALNDEPNWKTLKLHSREIEQLVRFHLDGHVESWIERHNSALFGGCITEDWPGIHEATARLNYLYYTVGVGERVHEIERDLFRERIGQHIRECGCYICLRARNWLFPGLTLEWKQKSEEPQWQAFAAEVRRQFPGLPDKELPLLTQRAIQSNASAEPADEAARRAVERHAHMDPRATCAPECESRYQEEWMRESQCRVDELLACWSGAAQQQNLARTAETPESSRSDFGLGGGLLA